MLKPPSPNPCGSCPYRRDVPSGIWARDEYLKLPAYDRETGQQPTQVFMCHQQNGRVCAGWCGTHDMAESLAVRFAAMRETRIVLDAIHNYTTETPLFSSGAEACAHGLRNLKTPGTLALRMVQSLIRKRRAGGTHAAASNNKNEEK